MKSLNSMLSHEIPICCLADVGGTEWLRSATSELNQGRICLHPISKESSSQLRLPENSNHQEFGKESFIRLTPLKWKLIRESLIQHSDCDGVLFSDLDIIWLSNPSLNNEFHQTTHIFAQDDSYKKELKKHFCSGIMFWPNSELHLQLSENLFDYHLRIIQSGQLIPDEPIFNRFFAELDRVRLVSSLDIERFIIGHRILRFLVSNNSYRERVVALHANYLVGDNRKDVALKTIIARQQSKAKWIFGFLTMLWWRILAKAGSLFRR